MKKKPTIKKYFGGLVCKMKNDLCLLYPSKSQLDK